VEFIKSIFIDLSTQGILVPWIYFFYNKDFGVIPISYLDETMVEAQNDKKKKQANKNIGQS
jgi:tRNA A-37 threonylcarbamoyl transferase component Bud32